MRKSFLSLIAVSALFADSTLLDSVSVSATKIERATKDVTQAIDVVDSKTIDEKEISNITEAINTMPGVLATSKNGGYDARLVIRGAGLKARYGVREIMVMRDGVPMTDPDSFTRFDFIDMQDVERIEVTKGVSILSANTTGGVIQILSKSVFDEHKNRIKLGVGSFGHKNFNFRYSKAIDESNFIAITASHRELDNDWRSWNEFSSSQASIKYGHIFSDDSTIETEFSYSEADMELPSSLTKEEFNEFLKTGKQREISNTWQHSGRYSKIYFLNGKYEKEIEDLTLKPRIYFNKWEHFHPVTGMINDSKDNKVFGTDLEFNYNHKVFGNSASLVAGVTARADKGDNSKKYTYKDIETITKFGKTSIVKTLSDEIGELAGISNTSNILYGIYLQESIKPTEKILVDIGVRADKLNLEVDGVEYIKYDWGTGNYADGDGIYRVDEDYNLLSPKIGATYKINENLNIYASLSMANQAPTDSEVRANQDVGASELDSSTSTNYEVGLKQRGQNFSIDLALYFNSVEDEIVSVFNDKDETIYQNAGKTEKKGVELSGVYKFDSGFDIGGNYAYSNYTYDEFSENVGKYIPKVGYVKENIDRSGNYLPFIPKHQYSLYAGYTHPSGLKARVQANSWGEYYLDNANSEKYKGYDFITDLMIGYEKDDYIIQLNVNNLFDKYYAVEVKKSSSDTYSYTTATPRSATVTLTYRF